MKVLYLSPENPFPPTNHVTMRTQAFFAAWVAKGIDVTFVCFPEAAGQASEIPENLKSRVIEITPKSSSFEKLKDWQTTPHHSRTGAGALLELGKLVDSQTKFDIVIAESLPMARPMFWLKKTYPEKIGRCVYIAHQHEKSLYEQSHPPKGWLEKRKLLWLESFEKQILDDADATFTLSEPLREQLLKYKGKSKILSTTVCFDFSKIKFQSDRSGRRHLTVMADFTYQPHIDGIEWFAKEIYPKIKSKPPVLIAGIRPFEEMKKLCKKNDFELVDSPPKISEVLDQTRVEIVPIRSSGGIQGQVIEAMGAGIPVVSTSQGVDGLAVKRDIHLLLGETADQLAQQVDRLFRDPALYAGLTREGKTFAARYDCRTIADKMAERLSQL